MRTMHGSVSVSGCSSVVVLQQPTEPFPASGLDVIQAICTRRVGSDDRRQFEQGLATNGLSFHSQQSSLVIVEEQSLATGLLQQGCDLGVLKLDDLLLTLVEDAADGHKQDMPGPEQEGHGYRRKSASFRQRQ